MPIKVEIDLTKPLDPQAKLLYALEGELREGFKRAEISLVKKYSGMLDEGEIFSVVLSAASNLMLDRLMVSKEIATTPGHHEAVCDRIIKGIEEFK